MELLHDMSPSAIDKEFRNLSEEAGGGSEKQLLALLQALLYQLNTRRDYELTQAYLGLALKVCRIHVYMYSYLKLMTSPPTPFPLSHLP